MTVVTNAHAAAAPVRTSVIDMHVHAMASDLRWDARVGNPVTGQRMEASDEPAQRAATFAALDLANVVKAMVSGDHATVLRWKEELDLPLAWHMHPGPPGAAFTGTPRMRPALGNPLLFQEVLARHPRLRLYVMHAGWPFLNEMIALLYAYPWIYIDVGVIDWTRPAGEFERYVRCLVDAGYGRRIMFGSDQMLWPEAIDMAVAMVESAAWLTPTQRADILYHNAARFLSIEPEGEHTPPGAMETVPRV